MPIHGDLAIGEEIHPVFAWLHANSDAQSAEVVDSEDLGKMSWRQSDDTFWVLTSTTPTWRSIAAGSSDLVNDTTPQLGGDLDVNSFDIVSVSDGDITITPNGTGSIVLDGLNWPQADGTTGQHLKTDGAGNLGWTDGGITEVSEDATPVLGGNLALDDNYISNDGDSEGISISNAGAVTLSGSLAVGGNIAIGANYISNDGDSEGLSVGATGIVRASNIVFDGYNVRVPFEGNSLKLTANEDGSATYGASINLNAGDLDGDGSVHINPADDGGIFLNHAGASRDITIYNSSSGVITNWYDDNDVYFSGTIGIGNLLSPGSQAYLLEIAESDVAVKNVVDMICLNNRAADADMDGTGSAIVWKQNSYSPSTSRTAGRISVVTETDWTSTASTIDSKMVLEVVEDNVVVTALELGSDKTATFSGNAEFNECAGFDAEYDNGTKTANFAIDWENGNKQKVTINNAGPLTVTFTNPPPSVGNYLLKVIQGATPGTLTWPSMKWPDGAAHTLGTSTGDEDLIAVYYDGSGYYAAGSLFATP